MGTEFNVGNIYPPGPLIGELRHPRILFWKSLPVSDLTTVLSKFAIPLVILPLLSFAIAVVTQFVMLLLSSAVLLGSGLSVGTLPSRTDRKSTRLNSSHGYISYAVFCLKK